MEEVMQHEHSRDHEESCYTYGQEEFMQREFYRRGTIVPFGAIDQTLQDEPELSDLGINILASDGRRIYVNADFVLSQVLDSDVFEYALSANYRHMLDEPVTIGRSWYSPLGKTAMVTGLIVPAPNIKLARGGYTQCSLPKSHATLGLEDAARFREYIEAGVSTDKLKRAAYLSW